MSYFAQLRYQPLAAPDCGRVRLPSTALLALKPALDALHSGGALALRLLDPASSKRTFAGVLDFGAEEGVIELPASAAEALGPLLPGALLSVRAASPPPAEAITLRALRSGVADAAGGALEAWLGTALPRARSVLVCGEVVTLERNGEVFGLLVAAVAPGGEAVSIHNVNAALTLEPFEGGGNGSGGGDDDNAPPVVALNGAGVRVEVPAGGAQRLLLQRGADGGASAVQVLPQGGAPCLLALFVGEAPGVGVDGDGPPVGMPAPALPPPWPSAALHTWALLGGGALALAPGAATAWPGEGPPAAVGAGPELRALLLNLGAAPAAAEVQLLPSAPHAGLPPLALFPPPPAPPPPPPAADAAGDPPCPTCRAPIPAQSAAMHALACARVHAVCAVCGAVLRRGAAAEAHAHCPAPGCGAVVPPPLQPLHAALLHGGAAPCPHVGCAAVVAPLPALRAHAMHSCPHRRVRCRFCGDAVTHGGAAADAVDTFNGLGAHEAECGSKTRVCTACAPRRAVRLKQWEEHVAAAHGSGGGGGGGASRGSRASSGADSMGRAMEEELPLPALPNAAFPVIAGALSGGGGGVGGFIAASALPPPPPPQKVPCANRVCAHTVVAGTCARCRERVRSFGGGDSPGGAGEGDAAEALGALYSAQLQRGCGAPQCRNPACPSGAGGARLRGAGAEDRDALREWLLAQHPMLLLLCVDDRARLEVPVALPAALAPATGAGGGGGAGAGASVGGGRPPHGRPPPGRGGGRGSIAGAFF
jgi:hypothetical protein